MGTSIEDLSDGLEGFLTSSVPDLQFECNSFHSDKERAEFDAYRDLVILSKFIVAHSVHEAGLANARVTDDDQFE